MKKFTIKNSSKSENLKFIVCGDSIIAECSAENAETVCDALNKMEAGKCLMDAAYYLAGRGFVGGRDGGSAMSTLLNHPTTYKLPWSRFENGHSWLRAEVVATKFKEDGLTPEAWAVREMGAVLTRRGQWVYEPSPSSRSDAFIKRTRFATAQEAAEAAEKYFTMK